MNIEDLTIGQAREIAALLGVKQQPASNSDHPYEIGSPYFIRTVTHHHTGRVIRVTEQEIVLDNAAWIPIDGRFMDAVKTATFEEVEPFPDGPVIVGRGSVIDAVKISTTPRSQK